MARPMPKSVAKPTNKLRIPFRSLQFQLIFWSILSLLLLAIIAGGYGFWYSYQEINDFQDDNLKNTAALLERSLNLYGVDSQLNGDPSNNANSQNTPAVNPNVHNIHFDTDDDDGAMTVDIVALLSSNTSSIDNNNYRNNHNDSHNDSQDDSTPITYDKLTQIPLGISNQQLDGHTWRTYRSNAVVNKVEVALVLRQQTELQDDLAKASAWQSFLPLIMGMAILTVLLPFIMWRMFKPVRQLHADIDSRHENDLSPLAMSNLPTELMPLVTAMNRLLDLVQTSIARQQRFIADAAHELRSPLTAISLQLQRLQRITKDDTTLQGLDKLAIRLKRNQSLVEQLLTLARVGNIDTAIGKNIQLQSSVKAITEQAIGLLIPIADSKNIELSVDLQSDTQVAVDATSLLLVVKNLLQNAIIYTPPHGQVVVRLFQWHEGNEPNNLKKDHLDRFGVCVIPAMQADINGAKPRSVDVFQGKLIFQVMDTGKGIPPQDYTKVFEPFVRLTHSDIETDRQYSNDRSDSATAKQGDVQGNIDGTGLGLSIVKTVCEQVGIGLYMSSSSLVSNTDNSNFIEGQGLCVTLVFSVES